MYVKEVEENMWNEVYQQGMDIMVRFFDKGTLILSFILGVFLNQIGYPKQIISFIAILAIIDILTKHLSVVIVNYNSLSFSNYIVAWKEKKLTSRQLKNGISIKTILYSGLLYIAHQLSVVDGIFLGKEISYTIYNCIVLVELSSVLENFIDMGGKELIPIRDYIKNKQKQLFGKKSNNK